MADTLMGRWRPSAVGRVIVVASLLAFVACRGSGDGGAAEARQACEKGRPAIDATSSTWGETLDAYVDARALSAKAATADDQWASLNYAFATLVAAWTDAVDAGGREARDTALDPSKRDAALAAGSKWLKAAGLAEDLIRSQCTKVQHT
jgi:hypothetical protein